MYFVLQGADFSDANLGQIKIELGNIGTGGNPNAKYTLKVTVNNVEDATIKLTPEGGSTVTTNGTSGTIEVTSGTKVNIEVSKEGHNSYNRELTIMRDKELSVELTPIASTTQYTLTIRPDPENATVTLTATGYSTVSGTGNQSITVANGTKVDWSVSADGYTTRTGNWTISGDNKTENITLEAVSSGEVTNLLTLGTLHENTVTESTTSAALKTDSNYFTYEKVPVSPSTKYVSAGGRRMFELDSSGAILGASVNINNNTPIGSFTTSSKCAYVTISYKYADLQPSDATLTVA
jgi:hypothetical protein